MPQFGNNQDDDEELDDLADAADDETLDEESGEEMVVDLYANDPDPDEEEEDAQTVIGQVQTAAGQITIHSGAMPQSPAAPKKITTPSPVAPVPTPAQVNTQSPVPTTAQPQGNVPTATAAQAIAASIGQVASNAAAQAAQGVPPSQQATAAAPGTAPLPPAGPAGPGAPPPVTQTPVVDETRYDESYGDEEMSNALHGTWQEHSFGDEDMPLEMQEEEKKEPESKTALKLDRWTLRRGQELSEIKKVKEMGVTPEAAADLYSACFEQEVTFAKNPCEEAKTRSDFLKMLMEQPEFMALREQTRFDVDLSEVGLVSIGEEYIKLEKEVQQQQQAQNQGSNNPGGQGGGDGAGKEGTHSNSQQSQNIDNVMIKRLVKVSRAIKKAQASVDEVSEIRESLGLLSLDKSGSRGGMDKTGVSKLFNQIKNSRDLARIIEFAGKFRRLARTMQKNKLAVGNDETTGVCLGGEISKLMKSQVVRLVCPATSVMMLKKIIDKRAIVRESRARVSVSKGPIMMLIDESGSMSGDRICTAKGLALAMAWIARQQNRWCCLVSFSDRSRVMPLVLSPQVWDSGQILKWCSHFFGGGTEPPLDKMADLYKMTGAPEGKTDVLFVSDGDICLSSQQEAEFLEWKKKAHVRMQTLLIGSYMRGAENALMQRISEEVHCCNALGTDDAGVQQALSI